MTDKLNSIGVLQYTVTVIHVRSPTYTLCSEKKQSLFYSCITLGKSNQFE